MTHNSIRMTHKFMSHNSIRMYKQRFVTSGCENEWTEQIFGLKNKKWFEQIQI